MVSERIRRCGRGDLGGGGRRKNGVSGCFTDPVGSVTFGNGLIVIAEDEGRVPTGSAARGRRRRKLFDLLFFDEVGIRNSFHGFLVRLEVPMTERVFQRCW